MTIGHDDRDQTANAGTSMQPSQSGLDLSQAHARIVELEGQLARALADLQQQSAAESERVKLAVELDRMRHSPSWRVTAPLRHAETIGKAAKILFDTVRRQAQARNGYGRALTYYAGMARREGISGIKARFRRVRSGAGFSDCVPSDEDYRAWVSEFDTLGPEQRRRAESLLASLARRPLISIIVPTYNSDPALLREMIESVREQIYPNWELCIADDASTDPAVAESLRAWMAQDARIKVVFRATNGHICAASNSALELAAGEFVALLDHDDIVPAHALLMVARYIDANPGARMLYSDEDKLDSHCLRTTPYFKPDWNPVLFLTQNMFSHLGVFETALVRQVGGFRIGFEGSQDYDLALRCLAVASADAVVHIPHVLYHWRITPVSTAGSASNKPYALQAAVRAVNEHLQQTGIAASVEPLFGDSGLLRVQYSTPWPLPKVSIIIPTRDGLALVRQCIDSILQKTTYRNFEIIVVDNGSVEAETLDYFREIVTDARVRVLRDESPFNFSALNNGAAAQATGDYLCLLNNDIEVISPDWLNEMVAIASQPGNGAVGAALWYPNNTLQHGGVLIGLGGIAGHMHHSLQRGSLGYFNRAVAVQNLSAVTAACLVIRRSIYEEVGGLNEELAVAFNDIDFCLRVREAGYKNVWTPFAELYHHESATRGSDMSSEKYQRFLKEIRWMEERWAGHFELDPAYNPNLSLSVTVQPFTLAAPPRIGMLQ